MKTVVQNITEAEVDQLRADTPGANHRIHLNNAGAALMPTPVVAAVTDYLNREVQIGGYSTALFHHSRQGDKLCKGVHGEKNRGNFFRSVPFTSMRDA